jgi:hypothetical protein
MFDELSLRGISIAKLLDELPTSESSIRESIRHNEEAESYWEFHNYIPLAVSTAQPKRRRMSGARARIEMYERRVNRYRRMERDYVLAQKKVK